MTVEVIEVNRNKSKEYNPYEHREIEKPVSDVRATANLIKASLGSGLMAGPLAFSNAGWGIGIVGTILVGIICGHCIHILPTGMIHVIMETIFSCCCTPRLFYPFAITVESRFMQVKTSRRCCKLENKPSLGYAETCKSAFSNGPKWIRSWASTASIFAEFALVSTYVGVCCIYTVLVADSVKQLVDKYAPSVILPVEYYCLIFLVPLIILCQIKHLKFLAIFSVLANILLLATYAICLYYVFREDINISDKIIVGNPARYPAFLSTVIFAMEGIGVVMPVENTMKKPQNFLGCPSVLVVAMSAIVFLYTTLGLFGYFRYGDVLRGSITLNLPVEDWPAIGAKLCIATSIFFTFPLQFFVVIDTFTKYTEPHIKERYRRITQLAARTIGVCCCVGIGIALPLLEQIINIVGACFYSILGLVIPAIIETVFRWDDLGTLKWILWKNLFIFVFGMTALISGCTVTILDIIEILYSRSPP